MKMIDRLRLVEAMRSYVQEVDEQLAVLNPTGRLILNILLDEDDEKVVRICEELNVSQPTAYRYIEELLGEISNIL